MILSDGDVVSFLNILPHIQASDSNCFNRERNTECMNMNEQKNITFFSAVRLAESRSSLYVNHLYILTTIRWALKLQTLPGFCTKLVFPRTTNGRLLSNKWCWVQARVYISYNDRATETGKGNRKLSHIESYVFLLVSIYVNNNWAGWHHCIPRGTKCLRNLILADWRFSRELTWITAITLHKNHESQTLELNPQNNCSMCFRAWLRISDNALTYKYLWLK